MEWKGLGHLLVREWILFVKGEVLRTAEKGQSIEMNLILVG